MKILKYNKRLLLFGIVLRISQIQKNQTERISRKRLCVMHGRDLSGLVGNARAFRTWIGISSMFLVLCHLPASEEMKRLQIVTS